MKALSKNSPKVPSTTAKIEQGGRLRHLLSRLLSPDQLVEGASGLRPFSSDMALCAMVADQSWSANLRTNDLRTAAGGPTGNGRHCI
jgi:hypothetical protein